MTVRDDTMEEEDGIRILIDLGCCADCVHLLGAHLDEIHVSEDRRCVAVPMGSRPPMFVCAREDGLYAPSGLTYHGMDCVEGRRPRDHSATVYRRL